MVTVYDVPADKLIKAAAEKLKSVEEIKPPAWVAYAKTGAHNERAPDQPDFWYLRCASLLRKLYVQPGSGVGGLRVHYGGRRNRGSKPEHRRDASGSAIRKALQQLEKAGFVKKLKKGRAISPKGSSFMDSAAKGVKG